MTKSTTQTAAPETGEFKLPDDLIIDINPFGWTCVDYFGTRALLEAEKLVPEGQQWPPAGPSFAEWQAAGFVYLLHRSRPPGFKGSNRSGRSQDWWFLRVKRTTPGAQEDMVRRRHERELRAYLPEESRLRVVISRACDKARDDGRFQRMLAGILPERKKPGRKPKSAATGAEHV